MSGRTTRAKRWGGLGRAGAIVLALCAGGLAMTTPARAQFASPLRCWVEHDQFLLDPEGRAIACEAVYTIVEIQKIVVNDGKCVEAPLWLRARNLPTSERTILWRRYREGERFRFFVLDEKGAPGGLPKACQVRNYTIKANDVEWVWNARRR